MSLDPNIDASETDQPEIAEPQTESPADYQPEQPQGRTWSHAEHQEELNRVVQDRLHRERQNAARQQEAAINAAQIEWQQRFDEWWANQSGSQQRYAPQGEQSDPNGPWGQQQDPNSPWARFDPSIVDALKGALSGEIATAVAPYRQQIAASNLAAAEAKLASEHPEYQKVRAHVLNFAVEHRIPDLDIAFRAYSYQDRAQIERDAVANYTKKKVKQAVSTPSVEGRGGGAPSSRQKYKSRDDMDAAAAQLFRDSQE
jgi:hypothetical protein